MKMQDAIRALYDVPVYRGSRSPGAQARGGWWANNPAEASDYATHIDEGEMYEGATVIPGQLNTRGFATVEGAGSPFSQIPGVAVPPQILEHLAKTSGRTLQQAERAVWKTDDIAQAVQELDLPGVTFKDVYDVMHYPTTQHYVNHPQRRRGRFAKFEDPNSEDLMAGLVLSLMGGGAGAAALSQRDQDAQGT